MRSISLFVPEGDAPASRPPLLEVERSTPSSLFTPTRFQRARSLFLQRAAIGGVVFAIGVNALPSLFADGSIAMAPESARVAFPMLAVDRAPAVASMIPPIVAPRAPASSERNAQMPAVMALAAPAMADPTIPALDPAPVDLSDIPSGEPIAGPVPEPRPRPDIADRAPIKLAHKRTRERHRSGYARNGERRYGMGYGRNGAGDGFGGFFSFFSN